MTHFYLIRHAESVLAHDLHVRDIMAEDRLTPEGVKQAERLRDRLATTQEIKADALLASTLPRAYQTAEIIAPALGLPIIPDDDLQEMREGDPGGIYWDEYVEKHGRPDPLRRPFDVLAPGGENWPRFLLRVASTLYRIADEHEGQTVVLLCHGGIVDGSLICFMGLSTVIRPAVRFQTHNTSITHWERTQEDGVPRWTLRRYNDALHLQYEIS
jgi:probable phosphoglycerate mutase